MEHEDNILTCSICNIIIGNLKEILENGLLETHTCFKYYNNIAIDFERNVAYPEGYNDNAQNQKLIPEKNTEQSSTPIKLGQKSLTENTNSNGQEVWTSNNIKLLINAYKQHREKFFSPMYNKKKVWESISETLLQNNVVKSGSKCDEKWRNLKKSYEKVLTEKKKTGNRPVYWEFFDDFHDIYAKDPRYEPLATASSSGIFRKRSLVTDSDDSVDNAEVKSRKCKRNILSPREREENKQRRHNENMRFKQELFEWLKENVSSEKK